MAHLIDKSALVAEIDKLKGKVSDGSSYCNGWQHALRMLELSLDTLEVKEVDLDMEINLYVRNLHRVPNFEELNKFARHFFELGMSVSNKAQKEELTNVFKYILKMCDRLINNGNYEADAYTQDTVEDIAELCNRILDGDYGKLVEVKEVN